MTDIIPHGTGPPGGRARSVPAGRAARAPWRPPRALALALVPLTLGHCAGWPAWTWITLAASGPAMLAALRYEQRLARRGGQPLVDLSLFASRPFRAGLGIAVAFMAFFASSLFVLSLFLQSGLGRAPLRGGLSFLPFALAALVSAQPGRWLIARPGPAAAEIRPVPEQHEASAGAGR